MSSYLVISFLILNYMLMGKGIINKSINEFSTSLNLSVSFKYYIYFPENYYDSDTSFPMVLFLHGSGERGDDIRLVEEHGIPKMINNGHTFPFITVAPQCPKFQRWSEPLYSKSLIFLVEEIIRNNRVDIGRIYATGLSMGGYGTLSIAKERPDLFSAIVPVCGGMDITNIENLKEIPIWLFHGDADEVVPVENSELIYDLLKPINPDIKITIYKGVDHNSWDRTYDNKKMYEWMLKQNK